MILQPAAGGPVNGLRAAAAELANRVRKTALHVQADAPAAKFILVPLPAYGIKVMNPVASAAALKHIGTAQDANAREAMITFLTELAALTKRQELIPDVGAKNVLQGLLSGLKSETLKLIL